MNTNAAVTEAEIEAALATAGHERSVWASRLISGTAGALPLDVLCDLASEKSGADTLATIRNLIEGLMLRHAGDDVTAATLSAIADYHIPNLIEGVEEAD